jgi:sn-glycerol 3-phosphate transport system substrate-binding protein
VKLCENCPLFYTTELNLTMNFKLDPVSFRPFARAAKARQANLGIVRRRRVRFAVALMSLFCNGAQAESRQPEGNPAEIRVEFWHAMDGERGRELDRLVAAYNQSQSSDRIVAIYKGHYTQVIIAAIFAMGSHTQPAIVQVNVIATATMMAARDAVRPVFELMRHDGIAFDRDSFLPPVVADYADVTGHLLSFPFNASTPILHYNKDLFRAARLDPNVPPKTWPEVEAAARALRQSGVPCGFTTDGPSWVHVENFSAFHDIPIATRSNGLAGLDTALTISNPLTIRHVTALAEWQKTRVFDYSGRSAAAELRFQSGECGIFIGSSAMHGSTLTDSGVKVGYGMLPYWPDVPAAPQNSSIGGGSLWVLRGRPEAEYKAVARFLAYLARPQVQAAWHQDTGFLPVTRAAYELTQAQGYYARFPGAETAIRQVMHKPPTENSRGVRLGSFVLIRDAIDDELEDAFSGKKGAKAALDSAVLRGNELLRQFERATR